MPRRAVPIDADAAAQAAHAEQAALQAALEDYSQQENPWSYVERIHEQNVPQAHRQQYYNGFIAMVATRPLSEQDALLNRGAQVFKFRSDTARRDVAALREQGADQITIAPGVVCEAFQAEAVHMAGQTPSVQYLVYQPDGTVTIEQQVQVGSTIYMPPQSRHVGRVVLLPTGAEEYGTDRDLFYRVAGYLGRSFHAVSESWQHLFTGYVFMTYAFDRFEAVPYLRAIGDWGSGKTRLIQAVGHLAYRGIFASGATTSSPIFHLTDTWRGTLILDEADFGRAEMHDDIIKILNVGYMKDFPVLRSAKTRTKTGESFDPEGFNVYGPKVMSMREPFRDRATESRCLSYPAPVVPDNPTLALFFPPELKAEAVSLRNQLLLWRLRHAGMITLDPYARPVPGAEFRVQQIVQPLLAVIEEDTVRRTIVTQAEQLGLDAREARRTSLEGKIVEALVRSAPTAACTGFWEVGEICDQINVGVRDRPTRPEKVGAKMKILLNTRASDPRRHPTKRTAIYAYNKAQLERLCHMYGTLIEGKLPNGRRIRTAVV